MGSVGFFEDRVGLGSPGLAAQRGDHLPGARRESPALSEISEESPSNFDKTPFGNRVKHVKVLEMMKPWLKPWQNGGLLVV